MTDKVDHYEAARLAALHDFDILDTPAEETFDRLTRLAQSALRVPIVLISLVDADRQWFKSRQGLDATETPREVSFCAWAIEGDRPFVVHDASGDERFRDNPLVTGEPHIRFYAGIPLKSSDGHNLGTLCAIDTVPRDISDAEIGVLSDLARLVMNEIELRYLARTDGLTGAHTHRSFHLELEREFERSRRHGLSLSLLTFDLDHFKSVNDTHGHAAGDAVLREIGRIVKATMGLNDVFGRLGGEEFALILPETNEGGALLVAERLRSCLAEASVDIVSNAVTVTASFGIATKAPSDRMSYDMLKRADEALYEAKHAGRNRSVYRECGADVPDVA